MARGKRTRRREYMDIFVKCSEGCTCEKCRLQAAPVQKRIKVTAVRRKCDGGVHDMARKGEYAFCKGGCGLFFRVRNAKGTK